MAEPVRQRDGRSPDEGNQEFEHRRQAPPGYEAARLPEGRHRSRAGLITHHQGEAPAEEELNTEAEPLLIEAYEQILAEAVAELRQLPRTKDARMGQPAASALISRRR
jgi:hypothetical protein